eukprot:4822116-Alexandrium_andersonii.AAC.1
MPRKKADAAQTKKAAHLKKAPAAHKIRKKPVIAKPAAILKKPTVSAKGSPPPSPAESSWSFRSDGAQNGRDTDGKKKTGRGS